jgi:hypothetical protein
MARPQCMPASSWEGFRGGLRTIEGGPLLSMASLPTSGFQVEYLYSLVYQALDFISGKR